MVEGKRNLANFYLDLIGWAKVAYKMVEVARYRKMVGSSMLLLNTAKN